LTRQELELLIDGFARATAVAYSKGDAYDISITLSLAIRGVAGLSTYDDVVPVS
jgi:hypothetical protein